MDEPLLITELRINANTPAHIARHDVTVDEVSQVLANGYIAKPGHVPASDDVRYMLLGETDAGRVLAVVVGSRREPGVYGLVTARTAHRSERAAYQQLKEEQ